MLIPCDIAASSELADEVTIMYAGQIVEMEDAKDFLSPPLYLYAQMLITSVPRLRSDSDPLFITGQPPSLVHLPTGCRFHPRCPYFMAGLCNVKFPPDFEPEHSVACWLYQDIPS